MRISPSWMPWLVAASTAGIVRGDVITFNSDGFRNDGTNNEPVFVINPPTLIYHLNISHAFSWTVNSPAQARIATVTLVIDGQPVYSTAIAGPTVTMSSVTPSRTSKSLRAGALQHASVVVLTAHPPTFEAQTAVRARQEGSPVDAESERSISFSMNVTQWDGGGSVTLTNLAEFLLEPYVGRKMYFELDWDTTPVGKSYSRVFTVLPSTRQEDAKQLAGQPPYNDDSPASTEVVGGALNSPSSGSPTSVSTTPQSVSVPTQTTDPNSITSAPSSTSSTSSITTTNSVAPFVPVSTPDPNPHHASSKLSTGAIAGIAVAAAIVGLGLLATLIFCLIRRRRRDRLADSATSPGGYGNRATPELIAQKEGNANVGVDVSPHSPYSDDGVMAAHAAGLQHSTTRQEEMPLAGYADRAVSTRDAGEDGGSLRGSQGGRMTPGRATPTAVRHLVEEGMTDDEIRRLEEEERELDQAIEQAGSGGRR